MSETEIVQVQILQWAEEGQAVHGVTWDLTKRDYQSAMDKLWEAFGKPTAVSITRDIATCEAMEIETHEL